MLAAGPAEDAGLGADDDAATAAANEAGAEAGPAWNASKTRCGGGARTTMRHVGARMVRLAPMPPGLGLQMGLRLGLVLIRA